MPKISQLPDAEAISGTEYVAIVQNGQTRKATASSLGGAEAPEGDPGDGVGLDENGDFVSLGPVAPLPLDVADIDPDTADDGDVLTIVAGVPAWAAPAIPAAVPIGALEIDWSAGAVFTKSLASGASTFTFANAASGMVISVRLTGNISGSTVTWPTVRWAGGTPPTQTSTGSDVYTFVHDGSNIYGSVVQDLS